MGIDIAEDIGAFKATKLNLFLSPTQGNVVMLTQVLDSVVSVHGDCSVWPVSVSYDLNTSFNLTAGKVPRRCVLALHLSALIGQEKISDQDAV